MGVFTVGRQVALEIDMPGWWLANASVDLNFTRGLYYDSATANPRAATDFLSCSRASVGYSKTAVGTLTQFASNALRITDLGLLVEDARTNLLDQSEIGVGGSWAPNNITITADQATAPNGTTTMDQISDGVSGGNHFNSEQVGSLTASANYSFSLFCKDLDRRYIQLVQAGNATAGTIYCTADLQTGTITDSGIAIAGTGAAVTSTAIEAFSNGVYRVTLTGITNADTGRYFQIYLSNAATGGIASYTGTNKSVYVWGAQAELGAFPSSYIPTTGAAAARAADSISCAGNLNTTLIGSSGSALIDFQQAGVRTDSFVGLIEEASISTNRIFGSDNVPAINSQSASDTISVAPINILTGCKAASGWSGAGRTLAVDNQTVQTSAVALAAATTQKLGSGFGHGGVFAYFRRLTAYNSRLADVTLRALTAP